MIDDIDNVEELENDISYVYSGYAPISVRLVQCVAQKGGVLSNPALNKANKIEGEPADDAGDVNGGTTRVQAHPIVGWKGFEDVLASIPGEIVDIVPRGLATAGTVNPDPIVRSACLGIVHFLAHLAGRFSFFTRKNYDYGGFLPWGVYVHRDCSHPMGCETEQRLVTDTAPVSAPVLIASFVDRSEVSHRYYGDHQR